MRLSSADLRRLADVAIAAANDAGQMIAASRPTDIGHKQGADTLAAQVVTDVDRRSEDIIVEALAPTLERFELGLLTEEREDDGGRLLADHFWCIDPLDGTLPFVEGVPGYAVSIALVARDGTPLIGAVHDPVEATAFHAVAGVGAFRDGHPYRSEPEAPGDLLSVFADRSFLTMNGHEEIVGGLERIAAELGLDGLRLDATRGAVMNACSVLMNPPACYFKFPKPSGGGNIWDFAATACLFAEFGATATDIGGDPLDLNRPDSPSMSHCGVLFATDDRLAARIRTLRRLAG